MERKVEQQPVYFTSHALQVAELRCKRLEKIILALLLSSRRLKYYFQQHPMVVKMDQPIKQFKFEPRKAVKSQTLLDFVVEMTIPAPMEAPPISPVWNIYVDGSCGKGGSGVGVTITAPDGVVVDQVLQIKFKTANNQAEYEALIAGLHLAAELGAQEVEVCSDSQLVVGQLNGTLEAKEPIIAKYMEKA